MDLFTSLLIEALLLCVILILWRIEDKIETVPALPKELEEDTAMIYRATNTTTEAAPGMDKQRGDCLAAYIVCEITQGYEKEILGVFSTKEAAEKYCDYKRVVNDDSFFYVKEHGVDEKQIPKRIGVEAIRDEIHFFDSEKDIPWGKDPNNEDVIRFSMGYDGQSLAETQKAARLIKECVWG